MYISISGDIEYIYFCEHKVEDSGEIETALSLSVYLSLSVSLQAQRRGLWRNSD
jgi:hypothetical protein